MKIILSFWMITVLFIGSDLSIGQEIVCFPTTVCNMLEGLKTKLKKDVTIKQGINITGDLHHFSPSIGDTKNLVGANFLVMPPKELFPMKSKILQLRNKLPEKEGKTLSLEIPTKYYESYSKVSGYKNAHSVQEAVSHFWLYPDVFCELSNEMINQLKKWNLMEKETKIKCSEDHYFKQLENLSKTYKNYVLIESHDAMGPLFKKVGFTHLALKGGGHHSQMTTDTLKKIKQIRNTEKKIIWIVETNIHQSDFWKKKKWKKGDFVIKLNTLEKSGKKQTIILDQIIEQLVNKKDQ